jgi:hypothetical protein
MNIVFIIIPALLLLSLIAVRRHPGRQQVSTTTYEDCVQRHPSTAAYDDFIQRAPGFVVINGEVLLAMIAALEPEKADFAAWERDCRHDA